MQERIFPRSCYEVMDGWMYLPRYIDKIRLHLAGKLHSDYAENLGKGFDAMWLKYSGLTHDKMVELVKNSVTDGQICDWVRHNVKKTPGDKASHRADMMSRPKPEDATAVARLQQRKQEAGVANRDDIRTFVDCIDADEKR